LTCVNYVADQYGMNNPEEIYVVDAHYDGVSISPGADDNGTGVVGVLEAMRILSKYSTNKTIRYALFDLEELGLVGSNVYLS
jgi:Zn-dependent M28 family amino/carboxypeptidase